MGNKSGALELYRKVLTLDPANATAKAEIIGVMKDAMTPSEFVAYLTKNAGNDKNMQNMLYDYAYKLHKENKIQEAISAYNGVITSNPSNVDAYVNLAICYASINDYKNAQSILQTAKTKFPLNELVLKTLKDVQGDNSAQILADAGVKYEGKDFKGALKLYLDVNPATENSLLGAAACCQELKDFNKAIEYYQKAESLNPKNAQIPYYIGYLYSEMQKWAESSVYLKKSISLNQNEEAKALLAYVEQNLSMNELSEAISQYENKDFDKALVKFTNILKADKNNAYAYYYRALIYDEQKKNQLAINDYLKALELSKEIPIANYLLAVDYDGIEKYKEAYKYYNQFISSYTNEDEYLNYAKTRVEELKPYAS
jgi:tetratricopeptide (TPR) repeat protein